MPIKLSSNCSRAWSASNRFFIFSVAKASRRAGARLVSPTKNCIKWHHFGANYLHPCHVCCHVLSEYVKTSPNHESQTGHRFLYNFLDFDQFTVDSRKVITENNQKKIHVIILHVTFGIVNSSCCRINSSFCSCIQLVFLHYKAKVP